MIFVLPPARKEFQCRNKRRDGPGNCDQMIYKDQDGLVKNVIDGRGGMRSYRHICPDRVGTEFHHYEPINMIKYNWHQQNYPCSTCGNKFNKEKYPLCPVCMRMECRRCGNLQHWITGKGIICFVPGCGGQCDPRSIKYMEIIENEKHI